MTVIVILLAFAAAPIADARWLRVAQREHYLPGEVSRFAVRWWTLDRRNQLLLVAALAGVAVSVVNGWAAIVPVQIAALGPLGLSMRGRTSPLAWTRRLRVLAVIHGALNIALLVAGLLLPSCELPADDDSQPTADEPAAAPDQPAATDEPAPAVGGFEKREPGALGQAADDGVGGSRSSAGVDHRDVSQPPAHGERR